MTMRSAKFDPLWIKGEGVTNDNGVDRVVTVTHHKLLKGKDLMPRAPHLSLS